MAKKRTSLIGTIKDSIINETNDDITISENTFISELLDAPAKDSETENIKRSCLLRTECGKLWGEWKKLWSCEYLKSMQLPLGHWILTLIWCILYFLYTIVYCLIYGLIWVFIVVFGRSTHDKQIGSISNTIIFTSCLIAAICVLIFIFSFMIKDVIIPPSDAYTNKAGVTTINQASMTTQSFFLMNASTYKKQVDSTSSEDWINIWTPTDIQVNEGDEVSIYISGSMYSDIGDMVDAAKSNRMPRYPMINYSPFYGRGDSNGVQYCIYRDITKKSNKQKSNKPYFGSILYSIVRETIVKDTTCMIRQVYIDSSEHNRQFHFKVSKREHGMLWFTFNDIFLSSDVMERILRDNASQQYKDLARVGWQDTADMRVLYGSTDSSYYAVVIPNRHNEYDDTLNKRYGDSPKDSLNVKIINDINFPVADSTVKEKDIILKKDVKVKAFYCKVNDSLIKKLKDDKHLELKDKAMWFKDNIGEVLVNIRVKQNIWKSNLSFPKKMATWLYRQFETLFASSKNIWYFIEGIIILFLFDFFIIRRAINITSINKTHWKTITKLWLKISARIHFFSKNNVS